MQPALSRIWTRVAVSISYDDNHYTKGSSIRADGVINDNDDDWLKMELVE